MVLCKYFLQGRCRFGDKCNFEHGNYYNTYPQQSNNANNSIFHKNSFEQQQPQSQGNAFGNAANTAGPTVDVNTLIKVIVNDMNNVEKGNQWRLTCYGPFSDKPAFPGFADESFEEIRLGFYESSKNNTLDSYKQALAQKLQDASLRIKALQNPSPEVVSALKSVYYSAPPKTGFTSTPFQQQSQSSVFGSTKPNAFGSNPAQGFSSNASVFGTNSNLTSSSIFGGTTQVASSGTNSVFGAPALPGSNIFGGNTQLSNNSNVFGGAPSNIFAGSAQSIAPPGTGMFGGIQATQSNSSIFATNTPSPTSTNVFGTRSTGSIFGGTPTNTTSAFANNNIFGGSPQSAPSTNVFGSPNQGSIFNSSSTFGAPSFPSATPFAGAQAPNVFHQQSQSNANMFGNVAPVSSTNIFGATPATTATSSPFGVILNQPTLPTANNAPFGSSGQTGNVFAPQTSVFTGQTTTPSSQNIFGSSQGSIFAPSEAQQSNIFKQNNSIFGTQQKPSNNIFGAQQVTTDQSLYSKLEELIDDEIKWFENFDDLDVMRIPYNPPTSAMCVKA